MDFHGNIDLLQNNMQQLVWEGETDFPTSPLAGRVVFKDQALYICVAFNGSDPIWIPITNKIDLHEHDQSSTATTWTITHNLNVTAPILQVYDTAGVMLIPDSVVPTSNNVMEVTFNTAQAGTAIVLFGSLMPAAGVGILEPAVIPGTLLWTIADPNDYGTAVGDKFGFSVGASSTQVIAGAVSEDTVSTNSSGKAYIFNASTGVLVHTLDNPSPFNSDQFGNTSDISDTYAIVGAPSGQGGIDGEAFIFNASTGALLWTLANPNLYDTAPQDEFGESIAISDSYAVVGAPEEKSGIGSNGSGAVYIFNPVTGALLWSIPNPSATSADDKFGFSVGVTDTHVIVGAPQHEDAPDSNEGIAYIYTASTGALLHTLSDPNPYGTVDNDRFGQDVGISDNYAIVGASGEADAGGTYSGKAYIFNVSTGALLHTLDNPNHHGTSVSDQFGKKVDITDTYAVVSALQETGTVGVSVGIAYIFDVATGNLLSTLENPNPTVLDQFGESVAIADGYAVIGTPLEDPLAADAAGQIYIYEA